MFIVPSKNYVSEPRWLAQSKRTPPLAGKLQSPLCPGWQYVSFHILNHAGWLTSVVHAGWLGVLFPETLSCWQWRAGNFFPGELNINEDWRRSTLLVVTTLYEQISQKWSLGTPVVTSARMIVETYLKRPSKQFLQNRCPHDVCQGSLKTFLQIGHSSRSSSLLTNSISEVDL